MKRPNGHTEIIKMPGRHNCANDLALNRRRVPIELRLEAPRAEKVHLAGDFNQWRAGDLPLYRDESGKWRIRLRLAPGRYEYRFIVDGEWQEDPHALNRVPNGFGSYNCVLQIPAMSNHWLGRTPHAGTGSEIRPNDSLAHAPTKNKHDRA
jgi:1,4-alpha-glucan branching enzyme